MKAKELGFKAVKLEICIKGPYSHNSLQIPDDREIARIVAACREAIGPDITVMVDVAYCWRDWKEALRAIEMFAGEDIYFVETPLPSDDIDGYAKLCRASPVRIAAGEWQNTRFEFLEFMNRDALDVVQPDVGRVGGLTEARRVAMHARDRGLAVVPHCWKSAIGIAASVHLAAVAPTCTFIEFLPKELADSRLRRDLVRDELPVIDGRDTAAGQARPRHHDRRRGPGSVHRGLTGAFREPTCRGNNWQFSGRSSGGQQYSREARSIMKQTRSAREGNARDCCSVMRTRRPNPPKPYH